jgi:hypothetical protein
MTINETMVFNVYVQVELSECLIKSVDLAHKAHNTKQTLSSV